MLVLRQDLDLMEAEAAADGGKRWLLRDPLGNKFFKLGHDEIRMLACIKELRLDATRADDIAALVSARLGRTISKERVETFLKFLRQNHLVSAQGPEAQALLLKQRQLLRPGLAKQLLRQYLFIRIHLLDPNRLLGALLPWVGWAFRPFAWWLLGLNTLFGVYLTSRQFDYFMASFLGNFTLQGMLWVGAALALVKLLHELGHALAARHYGCSVHSMGVAFMMFWPVLFTDTTDAWRLRERRKRVVIGSAGVLTELMLASVSLTLWNFVPDGPLRSVLLILASTTWLMTLAINLNPLMRFDGYFVLADLLGVDNLQARSFEQARWKLREWMFGFGFAPPERPRPELIAYALAVLVYRFFLYLGIALLIYHYFFKLLGLALMSVQVLTTLVLPLAKEVKFWWEQRGRSRLFPNVSLTFALLALLLGWLVLPTRGTLSLPAYEQAREAVAIYVREPGRLVRLAGADGAHVEAGAVLAELELADQRHELAQAERDVAMLNAQLATLGVDAAAATPRAALVAQLRSAREQRTRLQGKLGDERIVAPFAGIVRNLATELDTGQWVGTGTPLLTLLRPDAADVVAYVSEQDVGRMRVGQSGSFHADGGVRAPLPVEVVAVDTVPVDALDVYYAASTYGGGLQVREGPDRSLQPQVASYRVRLRAMQPEPPERVMRGTVELETGSSSPLGRYWRNALGLWRREAGF